MDGASHAGEGQEKGGHRPPFFLRQLLEAKRFEVIECWIVESRGTRRVVLTAFWNDEDHALTCTRQQNPVGIFQINLAIYLIDPIPTGAFELVVGPICTVEAKIAVPDNAGPIQFQTLYLKFGRDIFKVVGGTSVALAVEEPSNRVSLYSHINRVWLESLCLR